MRFLFALVAVLWTTTALAEYLEEPKVLWSVDLPGNTKKGNAVVAKDDRIFVTSDNGSLYIVDRALQTNATLFDPTPLDGSTTSCESGVTFVEGDDGAVEYVVYAIVDTPNDTSLETTSRVLGVNLDGSLRWDASLPGTAVGTPFVGSNQRIYMIYNEQTDDNLVGRISVLDGENAQVVATQPNNNDVGPFGPATGRTVARDGETMDVILFGESRREGFSQSGALYMLMSSDGEGDESYNFIIVSDSPRSVTTRPAVNADATEVYLAQQASRLGGWTGQDDLSGVLQNGEGGIGDPAWNLAVGADGNNPLSGELFDCDFPWKLTIECMVSPPHL